MIVQFGFMEIFQQIKNSMFSIMARNILVLLPIDNLFGGEHSKCTQACDTYR